ncbi:MAG: ABC transporter substrate-binding protein [Actinobacteria bacterium]|nr:ABC transporter substrate-binding protein [Actinomycetota bacterium]
MRPGTRWQHRTAVRALAVTAAAGLALSACSGGRSTATGDATGGATDGASDATFIFAGSADPITLDGAYVSDGESLRAIQQIFEGLVTSKPGTTEVIPNLAESWTTSPDGKTWTFKLKSGVTFTDGTAFDAAAVCTNFDRWYNFKGLQQSSSISYYWTTVFGGFAKNEDDSLPPSLYSKCEATDATTATITLTKASSTFLSALSLPSFFIASPKALTEFKADEVSGTADAPVFSGTFGSEHPIGTGPFKLAKWEKGNQLVLERNDAYWGAKAKIKTLVLKPIADGPARRQALEAGDIDGYDLVDPSDVQALKDGGYEILNRPAFNVAYVGFNQAIKPLDNPKVREAVAYALNRENVIKTNYPEGAQVATQFMPPEVFGYAKDVPTYAYDPAKAKALLAEAGVPNPTVEFWYPTDVSRPYMPNPEANYQLFKKDLEAVGFKVTTKSAPWNPDYLNQVDAGKAAIYLLGWTGDFGDPDNFIGTFFQSKQLAWGYDNKDLQGLLDRAEAETDLAKRTADYEEASKVIMTDLPGVPYAHTQPSLAFKAGVTGFVPSPTSSELFTDVTVPAK